MSAGEQVKAFDLGVVIAVYQSFPFIDHQLGFHKLQRSQVHFITEHQAPYGLVGLRYRAFHNILFSSAGAVVQYLIIGHSYENAVFVIGHAA